VADLAAARFGVAVWSAAELDALTVEMLCGLVDDLNAHTRFSGLALAPDDNAIGVLHACGWLTGHPMRTGFGRGRPEHDPWRFDADRLIASREADCILWISAYADAAPGWGVPAIALTATAVDPNAYARVHIQVGRPVLDHDAVEHCSMTDTLVHRIARTPHAVPSVAEVLSRIAAALPGAAPC
jgi:formylmethanofuran dehydrogenase subunit B